MVTVRKPHGESGGKPWRPRTTSRVGGRPTTIRSLATYVPPRVLTNADLEKMVDTSDEWILQRTGIRERHIVDPGVATSDLGQAAAIKAIERAGLTPDDIGVVIVGTVTPDMLFPSTACLIQHKIGAPHAWGFDLSAACSAFTYSLTTASQFVASGAHDHALVVGADVMSSIIDYQDRSTCVLFGDGAGAVVVSAADEGDGRILDFEHEIDGSGGPALCMPAGGSLRPPSHETVDQRLHYVKQDGATVFKFAVRKTEEIARRVLERNGLTRQRHRLVRVASGQPPHHPVGGREARRRREEGHHQHRTVRQHDGRHHPAGARRRGVQRTPEEGRSRAARVGRRRVHGRGGAVSVGFLNLRLSIW